MAEPKSPRRRKPKAPPNCEWHGDVLYGRKRIKGKLKRWSLRTGDVVVAGVRVEEDIKRLTAAAFYGDNRTTYKELVIGWAENYIVDAVGPRTAKRYASSLRQLEPFLLELYQDEVNAAKVKEIIQKRRDAGTSINTIRRDLTALSSVLEYAIEEEIRDEGDNPALYRLKRKRMKEKKRSITLPDQAHIDRVVKRCPGMIASLAMAAQKIGARQEELVTAERSRLDHKRRQLIVVGKGNKTRALELDFQGGYEVLRGLPVRLNCKWLFWHDQGEPYRNIASRFAEIVKTEFLTAYDAFHGTTAKERPAYTVLKRQMKTKEWVDIGFRPFRFHDLRHVFAVGWLKDGRSIYDLQKQLGHASIKTTEIYLQFLTAEEERAVKFGTHLHGVSAAAAGDGGVPE